MAAIELYTWPTPNGHKIHIMLEELGLAYNVHAVDIGAGDQFKPAFLKISPNNKIPAMVDPDGPDGQPIALMESGAMLVYLAEKTGRFMPADRRGRTEVMSWLMFQMAGVGPMLGQVHHFRHYAPEPLPYAIERYTNEATRLYRVLDQRLATSAYLGGGEYGIADIATFPWIRSWEKQGQDLAAHPHLQRWFEAIAARPAVERGLRVLSDRSRSQPITAQERDILFGARQRDRGR
ncbi:GST-like protein [Dongia mobilis]|uniref:GST-like protein n=1 Tax=Dongia mobilis TaxID=578943 RepID=A0A4R6WQT9_9PROT|nr:glutathione S-transferase N-terminal domain-containing protein [Dongia mobilis]TDQ83836.1 GST-like protein [Dongia mobilis]